MDITEMQALRKAKKKEIHQWITVFEQREGRTPTASDKEEIRPLYREFKKLESQIATANASVSPSIAGNAKESGESTSVIAEMPGQPSSQGPTPAAADKVDSAISSAGLQSSDGEGELQRQLSATKAERDSTKREIKLWIRQFEEREGRSPNAEDKAPIKSLYRAFKGAEKRLDSLQQQINNPEQAFEQRLGTANTIEEAPEPTPASIKTAGDSDSDTSAIKTTKEPESDAGDDSLIGVDGSPRSPIGIEVDTAMPNANSNRSQAQEIKTEKKRLKQEIQEWVQEFENREGHPPTSGEKSPVRHLFKRYKELDEELSRLAIVTTENTKDSASNYATTPTDPLPIGTIDEAAAGGGLQTAGEVNTVVSIENGSEIANTEVGEVGIPVDLTAEASRNGSGGDDDNWNGEYDRGRPPMTVNFSSVERMSPLVSLSPERPVESSHPDRTVRVAAGDAIHPAVGRDSKEVAPEGNGEGGDGSNGVTMENVGDRDVLLFDDRNGSRANSSGSNGIQSKDEENVTTSPGDHGKYRGEGVNIYNASDDSNPKMHQEERSFDKGSLYNVSPGQEDEKMGEIDPQTVEQQTTDLGMPPAITIHDDETHSTPGASVVGLPSARSEHSVGEQEGEQGSKVVMSAQEARVRRMRTRFSQMKSLLADDGIGSPMVSPRGGLVTGDGADDAEFPEDDVQIGEIPILGGARGRWGVLGDAIAPSRQSVSPHSPLRMAGNDGITMASSTALNVEQTAHKGTFPPVSAKNNIELKAGLLEHKSVVEETAALEETTVGAAVNDQVASAWVNGQLFELLNSDTPLAPPPLPVGIETLHAKAGRLRAAVDPPLAPYFTEYQEEVRGAELVIASVGVDEIEVRERAIELERLAQLRQEANVFRVREANLMLREERARDRVANMQNQVATDHALIEITMAREKALAPAFARARAGLEAAIRAQAGRVREIFGELKPGETVGARRFRVDWTGVPQPVEIRLHCIRAVRDRLPRGDYVMLASMAERLGGRVMRWSKNQHVDADVDSEANLYTDGGDTRPVATRPVQHGGRYFDRELRFDQSVYQVCPSKADVRPANVMVFELFRLAGAHTIGGGRRSHHGSNRHKGGELDVDTAVGWCVLPLADSRLRVIRGSYRIPMLRGEPNPNIGLHQGLEMLIAEDLESWLGNLYLDTRHLTRGARDGVGADGQGFGGGGDGYDVEYDHIRKMVRLGRGLQGYSRASERRSSWKNASGTATADLVTPGSDAGVREDVESGLAHRKNPGEGEKREGSDFKPLDENKLLGERTKRVVSTKLGDYESSMKEAEQEETAAEEKQNNVATNSVAPSPKSKRGWVSILSQKRSTTAKDSEEKDEERLGDLEAARGSNDKNNTQQAKEKQQRNSRRGQQNNEPTPAAALEEGEPPLDGRWTVAPASQSVDDTNHNNENETHDGLDEECLSDDDIIRGKQNSFMPAGEASRAADTAAGCGEGDNILGSGLRRRGEGARWDSSALGIRTGPKGELPRGYGRGKGRIGWGGGGDGKTHVWAPLTNTAEMEYYRFAVAADPGTDAPPTPAQVLRHKMRYIRQEVLLDLHPRGWRVVEYWLAVTVFVGALWLRVYLHSLGQWFLLYAIGVQVYGFTPRLYEFAIKYLDRSSSLGIELAFVWWGPTFVTLCFTALAALARLWTFAACGGKSRGGGGLYPSFSRFVAGFGVAAVLDPYLLFIVDMCASNHNCSARCIEYTSPSCRCHEGDAWKLFNRLESEERSGINGALLTITVYVCVTVATLSVLHQYLLHAHMNGRMADVWRRLNAIEQDFFVPHDLEVSSAELKYACRRAKRWRGAGGTRREVVLHDLHVNPPESESISATASRDAEGTPATNLSPTTEISTATHVAIYDVLVSGKRSLHRQFLRTADGTILEVFGKVGSEVGWRLGETMKTLRLEETEEATGTAGGGEKGNGIFAGIPAVVAQAKVDTEDIEPGSEAVGGVANSGNGGGEGG